MAFEKDIIETRAGHLEIEFIGHASLVMAFAGKVIHVDPYSKLADYSTLPKADLVLITHDHQDHCDPGALAAIKTAGTQIVASEKAAEKAGGALVMKNGDIMTVAGIRIEAVESYNLVHKRENGQPFHPKGHGNGYILTFSDKRVYIAGDTENIPEMKAFTGIDVAFLPMNLPYTMTPAMVADATESFKPGILYPYHYGESDTTAISALLLNSKTEVRIRKMK